MIVVDHEPQWWFLLQEEDAFLFDVNCSHGAFGYSWLMTLNSAEVERFKSDGRTFLNKLAEEVQSSAPGVRGSTSAFLGRNLSSTRGQAVSEAIEAWRMKVGAAYGGA